jgi:uncharacterized protein
MFVILSPAKTLDFETKSITKISSEAVFKEESEFLVSKFKKISAKKIGELMSISDALSKLIYGLPNQLKKTQNKPFLLLKEMFT